jgi:pyridoxal 5'-phosphate synthase pdxS subunit
MGMVRELKGKDHEELVMLARKIEAPVYLVEEVARLQRLPVINFAAGGIATPADAALMMQLGSDGVFVGSGIFKSSNPKVRAKAIVDAVTNFDDAKIIAEVSKGLGEAMHGIEISTIPEPQRMQERGW